MKYIKKTILLTEEQNEWLRDLSHETRKSEAEILREIIDNYRK